MELTTIDDALYLGMKNDVSFLIADTMNLYEQQSSYNPNMPLRYLLYAGMIYTGYVKMKPVNIYSPYLQKIPAPRCICFYNGEMETDDRTELRLSDAFSNNERGDIEVRALMININYGRNRELLEGCKPLGKYSWFVAEVRNNQKEVGNLIDAINMALDEMPGDFLIKPFLIANKAEVENMCLTEYNEAETYDLLRAECIAKGKAEGISEGKIEMVLSFLKDGLITESNAAKRVGMSLADFRKAAALYCN